MDLAGSYSSCAFVRDRVHLIGAPENGVLTSILTSANPDADKRSARE